MEWSVRRGVAADMPGIRSVEAECTEAPQWSDAVWGNLLEATNGATRVCFVAVAEHGVVGFVVVGAVCGIAELESVAVEPTARRQGVGRVLCVEAMTWARGMAATSMELEVRAANAGALAMYEALGFREQGRRRGYYLNPADDAVLMGLAL